MVFAKDGVRLSTTDRGQGRTVLFVHGNNFDSGSWEYYVTVLSRRGFRCVTYDRRGFGRSERGNAPITYDLLADDLGSIMSYMNLRAVTLVGHSIGCNEIARYAGRHGESRISGYVLVGTATPSMLETTANPGGLSRQDQQAMIDATIADRPKVFTDLADQFLLPGVSAEMKSHVLAMCNRTALASIVECAALGMGDDTDATRDLSSMTRPALLVHGEYDSFHPYEATSARTAALLENAQLKMYEGAGHGLIFSLQERLCRDIASFALRSAPQAAAAAG